MKNLFLMALIALSFTMFSCVEQVDSPVLNDFSVEQTGEMVVDVQSIENHSFYCYCENCSNRVLSAGLVSSDSTGVANDLPTTPVGWIWWIAGLIIVLIEVVLRFIPAAANWTPLTVIYKLLSSIVPNRTNKGSLKLEDKEE